MLEERRTSTLLEQCLLPCAKWGGGLQEYPISLERENNSIIAAYTVLFTINPEALDLGGSFWLCCNVSLIYHSQR